MENALKNEAQACRLEAEAIKATLPTVNTPTTSDPITPDVKDNVVFYSRTPTLTSPTPESLISRSEKIPNPKKFQGDRS